MDKYIYIILFLAIAATCVSCDKNIQENLDEKGVYLNIQESILTASTKAYGGMSTSFPVGGTFGLFICEHTDKDSNPYVEHAPLYNNIRARYSDQKIWKYNYIGYDSFPSIFIVEKKDDSDNPIFADVFAYSPYDLNITNPEHIPFKISNQLDMMFAIENGDPQKNKGINPAAPGTEVDIPLTFAHVLSLVEFHFTVKNDRYNHPDGDDDTNGYVLNSITVSKNKDKNPEDIHLYSSGEMNAIDGSLSSLNEADSFTINYTGTKEQRRITAYMLLIPAEPNDDDYVFSFKFSSVSLLSDFYLKREHLRHGNSEEYGLKPGYRYRFYFEIDNYIHFTGVEFGEWTTIDKPIYEIEI